jgi:hypothetical protein
MLLNKYIPRNLKLLDIVKFTFLFAQSEKGSSSILAVVYVVELLVVSSLHFSVRNRKTCTSLLLGNSYTFRNFIYLVGCYLK